MACCCNKILDLCRVSVCGTDQIKTGINAPIQGIYKLELDYLENVIVIEQAFALDMPLNFSSKGLNEKYKYRGKLIGPDGTALTITIGEEVFDCIAFQTGMQYPMNTVTCPAIDASDWSLPDATLGEDYLVELPLNGSGPYVADLTSNPSWMTLEIVDDKIVLSGSVPNDPDFAGSINVSIRANNCGRELPDIGSPTYSQNINVSA